MSADPPRLLFPVLAILATAPASGVVPPPAQPAPAEIHDFSPGPARAQRDWEARCKAIPETQRQREYLRRLSARPHHVGSPYQKQNAEYMRDLFASWGWDAQLAGYHVLFPTPRARRLELVPPTRSVAQLAEPAPADDRYTQYAAEQLPAYNAFSDDGDVTAPLVYVNYCSTCRGCTPIRSEDASGSDGGDRGEGLYRRA